MASLLSALDPDELVLIAIAILGLVPVLTLKSARSKLFTGGYLLLCLAAFTTNLESLVLPELMNGVEHLVGLFGSGLAFLAAAYVRRRSLTRDGDDEQSAATGTPDVAGTIRSLAGGK